LSTWSEPIPANTAPPREELELTGGGAISLEPGGQFELTGAPVENVHQTCSELMAHLAQVKQIAAPLGIGFLGLGMTPNWSRAEIPVMPKGRYRIMTARRRHG
jgi:glutamate--cysteine ligase